MSMLSAQCDELRERAATLRQGRWSDGADDARMMEDAADTIDKLRELVLDMWPFAKEGIAVACMAPDCPFHERCKTSAVCLAHDGFHDRMRELGIEVDA